MREKCVLEPLEPRVLFANGVPDFKKIVVVIEENRGFSEVIGSASAPYINSLAAGGALFTDSHGVARPSQPNYFALFSGSTQGVTDNYTHTFSGPNLDTQLKAVGKTFRGYAEYPSVRKHDPWESFTNSSADGRAFSQFPTDFNQLADVSFVVPNEDHDMHDGSVRAGDDWLRARIKPYADWARNNNSLLIVHFDEDAGGSANHIPTIFYGARVKPGKYGRRLDHYQVLATLESSDNLPLLNKANTPVSDVWTATTTAAASVSGFQWMSGTMVTRTMSDNVSIASDGLSHGIRITTSGTGIGSAKFVLTGAMSQTTVENNGPYDLFGTVNGTSVGKTWTKGSYTLTVQLFGGTGATGTLLTTRAIHFAIM
jgi:acid phosphatase